MAQQVLQEHKSLVSVTSSEAKCLLVQLWSTTPTFGYEFFSCAEVRTEKRGLIGISKTKVCVHVYVEPGGGVPLQYQSIHTEQEEKRKIVSIMPSSH